MKQPRTCYRTNGNLANTNNQEAKLDRADAQALCDSIGPECIGLYAALAGLKPSWTRRLRPIC